MNTKNQFQKILIILQQHLLDNHLGIHQLSYDLSDETLLDAFPGFPSTEIGLIEQGDPTGIYITFTPIEDNEDNLSQFMDIAPLFFKPLREYLEYIYSENTNNDACSFQYNIDSDHGANNNEANYSIEIKITDYLS